MHNHELTSGNIRSQLIGLALPLLLGNIMQQLYNTIDALIIGRCLGGDAFAAVGIAGTVMNLFIFVLSGFCIGVSILFGQYYGSGELQRFRREMSVSLIWGSIFTLLLSALFLLLTGTVLSLIRTPEELRGYVSAYLNVIVCGLICTYFYNLFSGILRSVGDTSAALVFLFLAVCVNTALDLLFVVLLNMGTAGAALATVLAQSLSALGCFVYLRLRYPQLVCRREDFGLHPVLLRKTLSFGFVSALQQSSLYIGKILVQGAVNTLDTPGISAFTAATRAESFVAAFADSGGAAMSVFISQNYGAGKEHRVKQGLRTGQVIMLCLGLSLSAVMALSAVPALRLFLDEGGELSMSYGVSYLRLIAVFYTLCFLGCGFVGYYRGTGRLMVPMAGTTLHISIRVIVSWLLIDKMGLAAVALGAGSGWVFIIVYQVSIYLYLNRRHSNVG
ncbi:MAG: MATE family efflux transporter [Candidatus Heteroscillospira sp.]